MQYSLMPLLYILAWSTPTICKAHAKLPSCAQKEGAVTLTGRPMHKCRASC